MNAQQRFELNDDAVKRAMMLGGAPVGMGMLAVVAIVSRLATGTLIGVVLPVVTLLALGMGGYLLKLLWPVFRWLELSDDGIRISYKDEEHRLNWTDIDRIEQIGESMGDGFISALFIATDANQGHVIDEVTVKNL